MKKITNKLLFSGLAVIFVLVVVGALTLFTGLKEEGEPEEVASEEAVVETREVSTFDAIENDGVCNIKYVQSERSAVEVSAPSNFMEHVVTDVDDGVLRIDYDGKHHSNNTDDIIIKVYSPTCKSIKNEGVGNITCDSLCADTLIVKNESVGSIELNKLAVSHLRVDNEDLGNVTITGKAETAKLINEGLGLIDVSGMECEDVGISNDGLGKVVTKTE